MSVLSVYNGAPVLTSHDDGTRTAGYTMNGGWSGASGSAFDYIDFSILWSYPGGGHSFGQIWGVSADSRGFTGFVAYDTDCYSDASGTAYYSDGSASPQSRDAGQYNFRSYAMPASASTPSSSAVTDSTATIACDFYPNTNVSLATVWLEYKKQSDNTWIQAGATSVYSSYLLKNISRSLTGLSPSTVYNVRLRMTRATSNDTSLTSATASFTTSAPPAPAVSSAAATVVTSNGASLNGSLVYNGFNGNAFFVYGTDPTLSTGTTQTANIPETSDASFNQAISGLTASTVYYFKAGYSYNGGVDTVYGSILSFTTADDPLADAAEEDHMTIQEFNERKYGVQSDIYFVVSSPASTSSDRFFNAASPFVAGDVQVSQDGGSFANVTNLPTRVGSTSIFKLTLTAAEMQGGTIVVQIVDQDGPAYRDGVLVIRTLKELGKEVIDATQYGGNVNAVSWTGVGTGASLSAAQGIVGVLTSMIIRTNTAQAGGASAVTLDAAASATNDYYKGAIIVITAGTGAGQSRVCTAYNGTTKVATVHSGWSTNPAAGSTFIIFHGPDVWNISPGAELSAMPTYASSFGALLQLVFQRFAYKREQDSAEQRLYKVDGTTVLASGAFQDLTTKQSIGTLS